MQVFRQLFPKVMVGHLKKKKLQNFLQKPANYNVWGISFNLMKAQSNWKLVVNINSIAILTFCFSIAVTSEIIRYYTWLNTCS